MSSADEPASTDKSAAGDGSESELNPLEGGRWRPVRPEELLRRHVETSDDLGEDAAAEPPPKVQLERRQQLEHHLKERPADLEAYLELGRIYRAENRPADAKRIFQIGIEIFPDDAGLLWENEEAVLARSIQQLREVTELSQRVNTPETERELERSQSDWACRRIEVCQARLARDPSLVHLRVTLAEAMYDAGSYEEAIEQLEPVMASDEWSPSAHLLRGRCLLELGRDAEAMTSLRAAALRRAVVAPPRTRVIALRMLCECAERLGITLTLAHYRQHLQLAEQEYARQTPMRSQDA